MIKLANALLITPASVLMQPTVIQDSEALDALVANLEGAARV